MRFAHFVQAQFLDLGPGIRELGPGLKMKTTRHLDLNKIGMEDPQKEVFLTSLYPDATLALGRISHVLTFAEGAKR